MTSAGDAATNKLTWLTDYAANAAQVDRPHVAAITGDQVVVLWERWTGTADRQSTFVEQVSDHHLLRGDDLVSLGPQALFVSGQSAKKMLTLNLLGADLTVTAVDLP